MSHDLLEALADHIHATRFGDGLEGLAMGQGLRLVVGELPRGLILQDEGLVVLPCARDHDALRRAALREIARAALLATTKPHTPADIDHLASVIERGIRR